jgi:hypothetical protein
MEMKWIMITFAVIMLGAFTGMALEQHERNQCRIEALRALVKPEVIQDICK